MARTRKTTLTITVQYDPDAWSLAYGESATTPEQLEDMDQDIAQYVFNQISGHFHIENGTWLRVMWRRTAHHLRPNKEGVNYSDAAAASKYGL